MDRIKNLSGATWLIVIVVVALIVLVIKYNKIIKLKLNRENAFADIDVQLKLRFDLVKNLINIVKGYVKHEKEVLESLTKARTSFLSATTTEDKISSNNMLTGALKSLFAVSENYPDLKANQNFLQFQTELSDIENKLAAARRFFNSTTKEFNTFVQMFPNNIISKLFGYKTLQFFELDEPAAKDSPKVEF